MSSARWGSPAAPAPRAGDLAREYDLSRNYRRGASPPHRGARSGSWPRRISLLFARTRKPGKLAAPGATIPKVCGGTTAACLETGIALYEQVVSKVVPVSSTRVAEMTKLLENIHRAVNIGLVNEMKVICDRMAIDVHEVIRAAATKPFGFVPYWPGPGLGGHCIPIDPFYLTWKARAYGVHTRFIELAGEINRAMPEWVVGKLVEALNERGRALNGSRCLVLGIAYKKNVDDMRESPAVEIMELLRRRGACSATAIRTYRPSRVCASITSTWRVAPHAADDRIAGRRAACHRSRRLRLCHDQEARQADRRYARRVPGRSPKRRQGLECSRYKPNQVAAGFALRSWDAAAYRRTMSSAEKAHSGRRSGRGVRHR